MSTARKTTTRKPPSKSALAQQQEEERRKAELLAAAEAAYKEVTFEDDGVAVIPKSKGQDPKHMFRFRIDGGPDKVWEIPNLQYIPVEEAQKLNSRSAAETMQAIFDRYIPEILKHVDAHQLMALTQAWKAHSGKGGNTEISAGESTPS